MADQQRTTPPLTRSPHSTETARNGSPLPSVVRARASIARAALKWTELAERRREHYIELYESGRWRHYHTDHAFLAQLRQAFATAENWARIAHRSEALAAEAAAAEAEAAAVGELPRDAAA